jgi:hypothetical protein
MPIPPSQRRPSRRPWGLWARRSTSDGRTPAARIRRPLVELLERSRHRYTPEDRSAKWTALRALADLPIASGALLLRFHEALGFLRAYPDDRPLLESVEEALEKFASRVAALPAGERAALDETGVAGTTVYCALSFPAARWLARRFPGSAEVDWDDRESEERLGALLPALVPGIEEEALVDAAVPYRVWLSAAKAADARSDLRWLLDALDRLPGRGGASSLRGRFDFRIGWELGETRASRTLAKIPVAAVFFHRGALARSPRPAATRRPRSRENGDCRRGRRAPGCRARRGHRPIS